jgi:hypothetical protein
MPCRWAVESTEERRTGLHTPPNHHCPLDRAGLDLSARQIGTSYACYLEDEAPTVGALVAKLNISGPAITRSPHRAAEFDLVP